MQRNVVVEAVNKDEIPAIVFRNAAQHTNDITNSWPILEFSPSKKYWMSPTLLQNETYFL